LLGFIGKKIVGNELFYLAVLRKICVITGTKGRNMDYSLDYMKADLQSDIDVEVVNLL
jgi:hypothetical protein